MILLHANVTTVTERAAWDEWPQNIKEKHTECYLLKMREINLGIGGRIILIWVIKKWGEISW